MELLPHGPTLDQLLRQGKARLATDKTHEVYVPEHYNRERQATEPAQWKAIGLLNQSELMALKAYMAG